eukprot:scaffold7295_cov65-Cyclotella_meneghiniana.AAC.1
MGFPPDLATMKRCDLFRIDVEDIGDVFDLDEVEARQAFWSSLLIDTASEWLWITKNVDLMRFVFLGNFSMLWLSETFWGREREKKKKEKGRREREEKEEENYFPHPEFTIHH